MLNNAKGLRKGTLLFAHVGFLLSLLAAVACALQPGGRKLRFSGPCGKELCTCQIRLSSQDSLDCSIKSVLCKAHHTHVPKTPGSQWRFLADGSSNEQTSVLLEFFWMTTPAKTPLASASLTQYQPAQSRVENQYSNPFGQALYPPPKNAA